MAVALALWPLNDSNQFGGFFAACARGKPRRHFEKPRRRLGENA
jgi:hypothetical protein